MTSAPLLTLPEFDDPEHVGNVITGIANHVSTQLAQLRRLLEELEDKRLEGPAYLGMREEWDIAADGLFGRGGVVGVIARALTASWANDNDSESAGDSTNSDP